jgi:hypothetical protein
MRTVTSTIRQLSRNNTSEQVTNAPAAGTNPAAEAAAGRERVPPPMVVPAMNKIVDSTRLSKENS